MINNHFCKKINLYALNELALRDEINQELIIKVLKGGIQTKMVHLTENYAIHEIREYGSSSLDASLRTRLDNNKFLKFIDKFINNSDNVFLHELKQKIKLVIDIFKGNKEVLNRKKLYRTLNSHLLACNLEGLVDDFVFIQNLKIKKKNIFNQSKTVIIDNAIVKNRCETFLNMIFDDCFSRNSEDDVYCLIDRVFELESKLWINHVFNTDLIFLGNIILKEDQFLLRDLGALTSDLTTAIDFIQNEAVSQIDEQKGIIEFKYSREFAEYYEVKALEFFTEKNLLRVWNN